MYIVPFLVPDTFNRLIISIYCGEEGIRTPGTLLEYIRFPSVPLQPLEHLSVCPAKLNNFFNFAAIFFTGYLLPDSHDYRMNINLQSPYIATFQKHIPPVFCLFF